tara:strand:+ start:138 stop:281 length:144 start_codon:yes stop_codon:yes gene_type:complete
MAKIKIAGWKRPFRRVKWAREIKKGTGAGYERGDHQIKGPAPATRYR